MLAISTAWNAFRCGDGAKIAEEIFKLGFRFMELNFSLSSNVIEQIKHFAEDNGITITSLHNYCPAPEEFKPNEALPDCFSLSSSYEEERKKAIDYTKRTISTAKSLKAGFVVLHTGRVEMKDYTRDLIGLYNNGLGQKQIYKDMFESFVKERKKKSKDYFNQLIKSLDVLSGYAEKLRITLGIETRFYYREIPTLEEFGLIFDHFRGKNICYWHDVGHAFIMEKLGFVPEDAFLKNYCKLMLGMHLHNIKDLKDHQAPTCGDFDFNRLRAFVLPKTIKVIEAHQQASEEDIKKSVNYLKSIFHD